MIVYDQTSKPIDKIAISTEKKFGIKASAKAFKLLTNTLYPDPISAPIRELSTNAMDSHVERARIEGIPLDSIDPFLVHLPNELEPYFYIRDYGTGMSEETIDKVYCTYFESTRNQSNEFTGAFGLGSKTPLCYSDTFNLISYYKGVKSTYTAFFDKGEPTIAKFGEEPTNEPDGAQISFSVRESDIREFVEKARRIYSRFKIKPKVIGNVIFSLEETKYLLSSHDWRIRESSSGRAETTTLVMGNIGYPCTLDGLGLSYSAPIRDIMEIGLEIDIEVGKLQPTVSREEIQYDRDSRTYLINKLSKIRNELISIATKEVESMPTYYTARMRHAEIINSGSGHDWRLRAILNSAGFTYGGKHITDIKESVSKIIAEFFNKKSIQTSLDMRHGYASKVFAYSLTRIRSSSKLVGSPLTEFIYTPTAKYLINNEVCPRKKKRRLKNLLVATSTSVAYVIEVNPDDEYIKYFKSELGLEDTMFETVSSLPLPPVIRKKAVKVGLTPTNSRQLKNLNYYEVDESSYDVLKNEVVDITSNEDFYYIRTRMNCPVLSDTPTSGVDTTEIVKSIIHFNIISGKSIKKLYVFDSKSKLNKIPENWNDIGQVIEKYYSEMGLLNRTDLHTQVLNIPNQTIKLLLESNKISNKSLNELQKIYKKVKSVSDELEKHLMVTTIYKGIKYKELPKEYADFKKTYNKILEEFPFIKYIKPYRDLSYAETRYISTEDYINDIKSILRMI